jgi:Holliday junction resolvasome RuvABC endonuclease subunit
VITLGVDLSLSSPALCLHNGEEFKFENCEFYFLTSSQRFLYVHPKLHGETFPEYTTQSERYNNIASWIVDISKQFRVQSVFIEDYSFGSVGRVFAIAENGGVVKHQLWKNHVEYKTIPPTVIKKFATGKGNADKQKMQECFVAETQLDIKQVLSIPEKQWNPSSDLIDAFYICKYGVTNGNLAIPG